MVDLALTFNPYTFLSGQGEGAVDGNEAEREGGEGQRSKGPRPSGERAESRRLPVWARLLALGR